VLYIMDYEFSNLDLAELISVAKWIVVTSYLWYELHLCILPIIDIIGCFLDLVFAANCKGVFANFW